MTRQEFEVELQRLVAGFRAERTMSTERGDAIWREVGQRLQTREWRTVVDNLLLGDRYPTARALRGAIQDVLDHRVARGKAAEQKHLWPAEDEMDDEYAQARLRILRGQVAGAFSCGDDGIGSPPDMAQRLATLLDDHPAHRQALQLECAALDAAGDDWESLRPEDIADRPWLGG